MRRLYTLMWVLWAVAAQAQKSLTLRECTELLVKNNLNYRESQIQTQSATAQLQQFKAQQLPQLGAGAGQNLNFGRSIDRFTNTYIDEVYNTNFVGANAQVTLFQGFQIRNQIQQGTLLKEAASKNQEAVLNQQMLRLLQAYIQVLTTKALWDASQEQVGSSEQQVERVNKQVAAGTVGQNTLFEIKAQLANDQFDAVTARNNYQLARLSLFQLMNVAPDESISFQSVADASTLSKPEFVAENVYDESVKFFPEIKSSELRLNSFDYQIKALKANLLPSLNLSSNYGAFYASSNAEPSYFKQLDATRNGSLQLSLNIPIMGRWQMRPRVASAQAQRLLGENQLNLNKQQLRQSIEQSIQQLNATYDRYLAAKSQVESLKANFGAAESRLAAGTAHIFEYTLAKANLARAEANAIRARYEYTLQYYIVDFYQKGKWEF